MEQKYARIIGTILAVIVIYLLSFGLVAFHYPTYEKLISRHSTDKTTAELQTKNIIQYFQGKTELRGFTKPEEQHLKDVRWIIWVLITAMITGIAALAVIKDQKAIIYGGIIGIILPIILYAIPFSILFETFHKILFAKGTWVFDSGSVLIQMYPIGFFQDFFKSIILRGFILSAVITIFFAMNWVKHKIYFTLQQN